MEDNWRVDAACIGKTNIFFAPPRERPLAREIREKLAKSICAGCPVFDPCEQESRDQAEYGIRAGRDEDYWTRFAPKVIA